jgi:hypothetical protein
LVRRITERHTGGEDTNAKARKANRCAKANCKTPLSVDHLALRHFHEFFVMRWREGVVGSGLGSVCDKIDCHDTGKGDSRDTVSSDHDILP